MNAVDTNILIYARDSREPRKKAIAGALITEIQDGVLLWQVACEYLSASQKLTEQGFDRDQARSHVRELRMDWRTLLPDWRALDGAEDLTRRFSLSWWDALLIAACLVGRVERLYSEDFDAYGRIDALEIVNPFR
jgi:predicted nucleic acid-binding protein